MNDSIAITGLGIICAIGKDAESVTASLKDGYCGIGPLKHLATRHRGLPSGEVDLSNEEMKKILGISIEKEPSRTVMMGVIAVRQALAQAGIDSLAGRRAVLISGTTAGGMDITEKYYEKMKTDDTLLDYPFSNECGESTEDIARLCGLEGIEVCTISTACSSALNSLIVGAEMLRNDEADIIIAGGTEALTKFHLNGFNTLMILDKEKCRPFDASRAGLNLGEGAAFLVMEKNREGLAYLRGYGNRCDAYHQTASSPEGDGAWLAMSDALKTAGLSPKDIQYVNAHGTGTPNNDSSESRALERLFGNKLPPISSTKGMTGHTTSASGSIEAVFCLLAMREGFIPPNTGWTSSAEGCITPSIGFRKACLHNVMCNSFGFGGNDSSIILSDTAAEHGEGVASGWKSCGWSVAAKESISKVEDIQGLKAYISPMESRRMGKLMKAAMLASCKALESAGLVSPGAIITATSRGMLETSQQFLNDIESNNEEMLKPTLFMQSTHNTIGSAIAIRTGCHGYNITYSQGAESEKWAMRDARRLIECGKVPSVLVCTFDESTPTFNSFSGRAGKSIPDDVNVTSTILIRNSL